MFHSCYIVLFSFSTSICQLHQRSIVMTRTTSPASPVINSITQKQYANFWPGSWLQNIFGSLSFWILCFSNNRTAKPVLYGDFLCLKESILSSLLREYYVTLSSISDHWSWLWGETPQSVLRMRSERWTLPPGLDISAMGAGRVALMEILNYLRRGICF